MNRMPRRYTRNQNQLAAFIRYDVGGSRQQVAGDAVGDLAKATEWLDVPVEVLGLKDKPMP